MEHIDAPGAWDVQTGDDALRIAVLDLDNDADHGDLRGNVSRSERGPSAGGHGTHVAGTACGAGDNGRGISGVAWNCDLRFFAATGSTAATASQMRSAVDDGNRAVNMSLNYVRNGDCSAHLTAAGLAGLAVAADEINTLFGRAVIYAQRTDRDVLWLLAAGNECGRDASLTAPGGLGARFPSNTMTVAAIGEDGNLASFSNVGLSVAASAPGVNILSTTPPIVHPVVLQRQLRHHERHVHGHSTRDRTRIAGHVAAPGEDRCGRQGLHRRSVPASGDRRCGPRVPDHRRARSGVLRGRSRLAGSGRRRRGDRPDRLHGRGAQPGEGRSDTADQQHQRRHPDSDFRFAVVSYEDYEGFFDSGPCGSTYANRYGTAGDEPFRLDSALSADSSSSQSAIDGLSLGNGMDGPEGYGRALWEFAQADTGAALGWRPGALRLVLNHGNVPHDMNLDEGVVPGSVWDTGIDPGPGRDHQLRRRRHRLPGRRPGGAVPTSDIRLLHVNSSGYDFAESHWRHWASLTGGAYASLGSGRTLTDVLIELLGLIE